MNEAAAAMERAIRMARLVDDVARALKFWEVWILLGSASYLGGHFVRWAAHGFSVVAR